MLRAANPHICVTHILRFQVLGTSKLALESGRAFAELYHSCFYLALMYHSIMHFLTVRMGSS